MAHNNPYRLNPSVPYPNNKMQVAVKSTNPYSIKKPNRYVSMTNPLAMNANMMLATSQAEPTYGGQSTLENWCIRALVELGYKQDQMQLQVWIRGGRDWLGGQVVDIVVYNPWAIPIYLKGDYWHRDSGIEMLETVGCYESFGVMPVVIWGSEAPTYEAMKMMVLERVGRP